MSDGLVCCLQESDLQARRLSVRIEPRLERSLRQKAALANKSESEILRDALNAYLGGEETELTAYDLARQAGLIGCAKAAPRDLSTNPKYFKGFGGK